jgi:hypothetical protein
MDRTIKIIYEMLAQSRIILISVAISNGDPPLTTNFIPIVTLFNFNGIVIKQCTLFV